MAEVIGAVASAISIAGLFKACIEAFEVIKAAQRQELDFQKAVLKLQIEKCRLYTWGEAMGLTTPPNPGQPRPFDTFEFKPLVIDILSMLLRLFSDTSKLEDRYGCRVETEAIPPTQLAIASCGTDHVGNLSACFSNFQLNSGEVDTSLKKKLKWLVQDRKKFPALVAEAREFIDGLQDITKSISPVGLQTQVAVHRIQQISQPDTLQLVADVCETDYPAFSDAASVRLEIVSMAATRCDEIEQWKNDIEPSEDVFSEVESMTVTEMKHRLLQYMLKETSPTAAGNFGDGLQPSDDISALRSDVDWQALLPNSEPAKVLSLTRLQRALNSHDPPPLQIPIDQPSAAAGSHSQMPQLRYTPKLPMAEPHSSSRQQKPFRVVSNPRYTRGHPDPDELGPFISNGKIRGLQTLPLLPMPVQQKRPKPGT